jgi:ABC-type multidrug transport system permease subunit
MSTLSPPSPGGAVFWRFVRLSLSYYQKNVVSLLMTLIIPLGLLLFATFSFYAITGPAPVTIGVSDNVPAAILTKIDQAKIDGLQVIPISGTVQQNIQNGIVKMVLTNAHDTGQPVIYSLEQNKTSATLVAKVVAQVIAGERSDIPSIAVRSAHNGNASYAFVPGLMIMSIINLALFTTGAKLLQDRANGTMRLYRLFPVPLYIFFSAELSTKFILALVQACIFILLGDFLLDLHLSIACLLQTMIVAALCSLSLLIMGLAIGSNLRAASSGIHLFTVLNLTMAFLGDVMFPNSTTQATRAISALLPSTHCTNLLRIVMFELPPSFAPIWSIAYMVVFTAGCAALALRGFKFTAEE